MVKACWCACVGFLGLLVVASAPKVTAAQEELRATRLVINNTQQPDNWKDLIHEVSTSEEWQALITTVASAYGVPPQLVGALLYAGSKFEHSGEEWKIWINADEGYAMCNATVTNRISHVGPGAFGMTVYRTHAGIYNWLRKEGIGGGRTWVEYEVEFVAVRSDLYDSYLARGKCVPENTVVYSQRF